MRQLLDEISALRINPNAYEEWSDYRKQLTDIVITGTNKSDSLAVYGAGSCNDIDLGRLAEHFSEVTLLDINEEAMKSAVRRYGLDGSPKVRIDVFDFVGISEEDYERMAGRMTEALDSREDPITEGELVMKLRPAIETFYGALERNLFRAPRYDAVLAAGLHSQLNQTAVSIWRNLCARRGIVTDPLHDPVSALFHERTYPIIVRFDQLFFYSTKKKAFIAYEEGIEGRRGHVQGAMQLRDDLDRRIRQRQVRLIQRHQAVWPQNREKGIVFEMSIDELSIKK